MRKRHLISTLLVASLILAGSTSTRQPELTHAEPQLFTIVVLHNECTECGDCEIDSGKVVVPKELQRSYIDACAKSPRFGNTPDKRARLIAFNNRIGYQVGNVKLESDKDFEDLFLLSGKKPSNSYGPSDNPWDFNRRYRITVEVTGIKWSYLAVRVRKAVRLADRKD